MRTVLRVLLLLVLVCIAGLFNVGLIDIRMEEISYLLDKVAVDESATKTFGIVAKYELIKRRMLYGEEDLGNFELEAKIAALTSGDPLSTDSTSRQTWYKLPVRWAINGIRFLLGKEIINPTGEDKILKVLELGYFWERNRKYSEAIKIYTQVLEMSGVTPEIKAAVLAHKAFCHSMLSELKVSKEIYEHVITSYPNTRAGILSWKLLDFIETMEKQREDLTARRLNDFEKAKQFYRVMDYRNTIKFISRLLMDNPDPQTEWEAHFYKGRAHEELGEIDEAIAEYYKVIRNDKSKVWSKQANRRMLMLGEFYEQRTQLAQEARKQLSAYQDQGFMNTMEQFSSLVEESSLRKELLKGDRPHSGVSTTVDTSLMSIINQIGQLDLTGEKARQRQKELEEMKKELIESGKLPPAEIAELERLQNLKGNPFRRPTAIKKVIDDHTGQLKYLYNRALRRGLSISGRMEVEITITPEGQVARTQVLRSSVGSTEFENQVTAKIQEWKFEKVPQSLGNLKVNYPFEFFEEN